MFLISDLMTLSHQIAQNCVKIAVLFSNISFFMPQVRLIVREERKGNYLHKEIFIRGCDRWRFQLFDEFMIHL